MRFIVENYAAAGCTCEKRPLEFRSLDKARAEVRRRLKVQALRAERQWKPRWPGAIEAWYGLLGVRTAGGVVIFRERGESKVKQIVRRGVGAVERPERSAAFEPGSRETEKRVQRAIVELGGSRKPVRLAALRKRLGSPEQAAFARVLLDLQEQELAILIREDNPPDITPEDREAAVLVAGNPRHLVFLQ